MASNRRTSFSLPSATVNRITEAMPDYREQDDQRVVDESQESHFLPGTGIEIIRAIQLAAPPEHVLFDFDGTLSLIREGWPDVMVPMMVQVLLETGTDETAQQLHRLAYDFVMQLNGKQTTPL